MEEHWLPEAASSSRSEPRWNLFDTIQGAMRAATKGVVYGVEIMRDAELRK
jgi:hypothetical protein